MRRGTRSTRQIYTAIGPDPLRSRLRGGASGFYESGTLFVGRRSVRAVELEARSDFVSGPSIEMRYCTGPGMGLTLCPEWTPGGREPGWASSRPVFVTVEALSKLNLLNSHDADMSLLQTRKDPEH